MHVRIFLLIAITGMSLRMRAQNFDLTTGAAITHQKGMIILSSYPGSSQSYVMRQDLIDENVKVPEVGLSYYFPFYPKEGPYSFGAMAGMNLLLAYSKKADPQNFYGQTIGEGKSSPLYAAYAIPVVGMFRFGSAAFERNDEGIGFGIGAGISATGFRMPYDRGFMVSPDICAEIRYNKIGLRLELLTKKFQSNYITSNGELPRITTNFTYVSLMIRI
jgi:hypothetical protein